MDITLRLTWRLKLIDPEELGIWFGARDSTGDPNAKTAIRWVASAEVLVHKVSGCGCNVIRLRLMFGLLWTRTNYLGGTSDPGAVQERNMSRLEPSAGLGVIGRVRRAVTGQGEGNVCAADCPI